MCIFYNATFFFLAMHICYNANLLHARRKRSTLTSSFFATTQKKKSFLLIACFLAFFLLQYFISLWHAIALLHGIRRRNTHMLLFLPTTYPILFIYFVFLFDSFVFLVAMLLDASLNSSQGLRDEPSNNNNGTKVIERITWNTFPNSTC